MVLAAAGDSTLGESDKGELKADESAAARLIFVTAAD